MPVTALLGAAWIPVWLFLNLYLQQVLGHGAFEAGAGLAAGIAWLQVMPAVGSLSTDVLPGSLVAAVGLSLTYIPVTMAALLGRRPAGGGPGLGHLQHHLPGGIGARAGRDDGGGGRQRRRRGSHRARPDGPGVG